MCFSCWVLWELIWNIFYRKFSNLHIKIYWWGKLTWQQCFKERSVFLISALFLVFVLLPELAALIFTENEILKTFFLVFQTQKYWSWHIIRKSFRIIHSLMSDAEVIGHVNLISCKFEISRIRLLHTYHKRKHLLCLWKVLSI